MLTQLFCTLWDYRLCYCGIGLDYTLSVFVTFSTSCPFGGGFISTLRKMTCFVTIFYVIFSKLRGWTHCGTVMSQWWANFRAGLRHAAWPVSGIYSINTSKTIIATQGVKTKACVSCHVGWQWVPRLHFRMPQSCVHKGWQACTGALITPSAVLSMATLTLVCVVSLPGSRYDLLPGTLCSGRRRLCEVYFNPKLAAVQSSSPSRLGRIKPASCPVLPQHHHHIAIKGLFWTSQSPYGSEQEQALSIIKLHLI